MKKLIGNDATKKCGAQIENLNEFHIVLSLVLGNFRIVAKINIEKCKLLSLIDRDMFSLKLLQTMTKNLEKNSNGSKNKIK